MHILDRVRLAELFHPINHMHKVFPHQITFCTMLMFYLVRVGKEWTGPVLPHPLKSKGYIWATSWEKPVLPYANNKGQDQPAHPFSLICTFVVCCLDSIIPQVSISEISSFYLTFVAVQAGLSLPLSQIPKTGFLMTWLICIFDRVRLAVFFCRQLTICTTVFPPTNNLLNKVDV